MIRMPEFSPIRFLTAFRSRAERIFETHMESTSLFRQQLMSVMSFGVMHSSKQTHF